MYFLNLGTDKCPVSGDPCTRNMVNGPKHCCKLDDGTFTIFGDHSENYSVGKSLC